MGDSGVFLLCDCQRQTHSLETLVWVGVKGGGGWGEGGGVKVGRLVSGSDLGQIQSSEHQILVF